jgi:hypothetical protein
MAGMNGVVYYQGKNVPLEVAVRFFVCSPGAFFDD